MVEDVVFSNVFAWEGAIAVASQQDDGIIGSHRFMTVVPDRQTLLPEFLVRLLFESPWGSPTCVLPRLVAQAETERSGRRSSLRSSCPFLPMSEQAKGR